MGRYSRRLVKPYKRTKAYSPLTKDEMERLVHFVRNGLTYADLHDTPFGRVSGIFVPVTRRTVQKIQMELFGEFRNGVTTTTGSKCIGPREWLAMLLACDRGPGEVDDPLYTAWKEADAKRDKEDHAEEPEGGCSANRQAEAR